MPAVLNKLRLPSDPHSSRAQDQTGAVLNPVAASLARTPIMGAPPPPWIRPEKFAADFKQIPVQAQTAFHLDALNYTHVKLSLQTAAGAAADAALFILPMGLRPSELLVFPALNTLGGVFGAVEVRSDGTVGTANALAAGAGLLAYFSFLAGQ